VPPDGRAALATPRCTTRPLVDGHDVALVDLDGVVYRGRHPVHGAVSHLVAARRRGLRLGYVTNNAARTPAEVAAHLRELGVALDDGDVVTAAQAAARLVAATVPTGSRVLVIGGPGLEHALEEHGLEPVRSLDDSPAAVVQGFHRSIGWEQLAEGAYAVASGLPWVASNLDRTVPTPRGTAPGNGTLVAAVREATGATPQVAGKPEPALIDESVLRTRAERPLMVGDRLDTDVSGAARWGMPSLLVLTGVTSLQGCVDAVGDERPDYVAGDLGGLLAVHTPVTVDGGQGGAAEMVARCDGWIATAKRGRVRLDGTDRGERLGALRATVAAGWAARDAGQHADVGEVAERLAAMMDAPAPATRSPR